MRPMAWPTTKSPSDWTLAVRSSLCGANASLPTVWQAWKSMLVRVAPGLFPPDLVVQIKALACELSAKHGLPLSRWSTADLVRQICQSGLVASISGSTLWRGLHEDAIRPWYHRSWIFPRDPDFAVKAGRVLDLYARQWQDRALKDDEFVISADEKTSIQARRVGGGEKGYQSGGGKGATGAVTLWAIFDPRFLSVASLCQFRRPVDTDAAGRRVHVRRGLRPGREAAIGSLATHSDSS